jgi:hypothetical protein
MLPPSANDTYELLRFWIRWEHSCGMKRNCFTGYPQI